MPGASSLAGALAGFCGAPLADFVGAVDMLVINQPQRDAIFLKAYLAETAEAFCDGHVAAFDFFGGVPQSILYDSSKDKRLIQ